MDILEKVSELVETITKNEKLMAAFKEDPIKAIKSLLKDVDLDDEALEKLAKAVKGKIDLDKASSLLGGLKKLF